MSMTTTAASTPGPDLAAFALAAGFHTAATACGLKPSGNLDLGLVWSEGPCSAAGVFTTNRVQAAPVHVCRETLAAAAGRVRGVLYNSGCANAVTGERGLTDARRMRELAAAAIDAKPDELLVLSTGVIGKFLDMGKLASGITALRSHSALRAAGDAARAIMTTDTRAKLAFSPLVLPGGRTTIAGFAKGAGMIHPNMATMLSVITTDARIEPARLDRALRSAVERSFNRISVDGDMSTNDTVLLLANGVAGNKPLTRSGHAAFQRALTHVCLELAQMIVRDGEGVSRFVTVRLSGARSVADADAAVRAVANSALVKTSWHGGDPNWGRIIDALGYSPAKVQENKVDIGYSAPGSRRVLWSLRGGQPTKATFRSLCAAAAHSEFDLHIRLNLGRSSAILYAADLTEKYVDFNKGDVSDPASLGG